jgi:hypothetical protein
MLIAAARASEHPRGKLRQGDNSKSWHRCHRHREHRTRSRRKTIHCLPAKTDFFEDSLLPKLSTLFRRMFIDLPPHEREEAAQDCLCQSWLAYQKLPHSIATRISAKQLAARAHNAYRVGGRFLALA